ncbi:hypothetical protein [Burkholderia multivorans]|uniref:hypothetical protein n=1 Tax=Burkholderia multivorans TaxID=87883 RepID=UPI0011B2176E|nr:hypothetical protein [Burkholderia multivorans]
MCRLLLRDTAFLKSFYVSASDQSVADCPAFLYRHSARSMMPATLPARVFMWNADSFLSDLVRNSL